ACLLSATDCRNATAAAGTSRKASSQPNTAAVAITNRITPVVHAARTTGVILFVIATAAVFGWLLAFLEVPAAAVAFLQSVAESKQAVLLLIVVILLSLGMFMDLAPKILICTPIFLPVVKAYGIDPIHFGLVMVLAGGMGLVTPPIGSVLFIGTSIGKITVAESMRTIWPFWLAGLTVLIIVAMVPEISLWLPAVLKH
ncbi:MAG: TRAP transporter large permease subunit, partial [Comamonadaceae bacterium]